MICQLDYGAGGNSRFVNQQVFNLSFPPIKKARFAPNVDIAHLCFDDNGSCGIVVVDRDKCLGRDKCGYPCSIQCPAGNDVLGFVSLIREGKYAEAWALLIENNPFPGVCGRVCAHPCESICTRGQVDERCASSPTCRSSETPVDIGAFRPLIKKLPAPLLEAEI